MSERFLDDADWAPSAEQSSEEDEAQEGNELAREEHQSDAAEHVAIHIEDEDDDADYSDDDDVEVSDPEADAIVNDALEIDEAAEAEAAAEVLTDDLAEEALEGLRGQERPLRALAPEDEVALVGELVGVPGHQHVAGGRPGDGHGKVRRGASGRLTSVGPCS